MAAGGVLAALGVAYLMRTQPLQAVMVGPHVVVRGTHLEGESLPAAHPLRVALPTAASDSEPEAYVEHGEALLRLRRHCAWGLPGRNPYRGSVMQALQTATLSSTVVKQIAADIKSGKRVDRVDIGNDGIRARRSGREFDAQRVAMTYGMTMCVDTRVNFSPGHTEAGDLYEAMDDDGRIYAVMVPDACGNVSVLGQRYVTTAAPANGTSPAAAPGIGLDTSSATGTSGTADGTAFGTATGSGVAAIGKEDAHPWLRLAPEHRIRELPRALQFTEKAPEGRRARTDARNSDEGTIDAPGTLVLSGLALFLAWLFGRKPRGGRC